MVLTVSEFRRQVSIEIAKTTIIYTGAAPSFVIKLVPRRFLPNTYVGHHESSVAVAEAVQLRAASW